jgi:sugar O-acyltransferase (sialic acid O-acetyltransferase NeuD family)
MKKLIIFGGGGHCNACIDVILEEKKFKIDFIVDENIKDYKKFNFVIKNLVYFKKYFKKSNKLFVGVGLIKNSLKRLNLIKKLEKFNLDFAKIISPHSVVSKYSNIYDGTIVMHNCVINNNATVMQHSIINTSSIIEHDVTIGKNCHISTGSIINGGSKVGDNTFIGSGTIIHQNIQIGDNCLIGAGKVIKRNLPSNSIIK